MAQDQKTRVLILFNTVLENRVKEQLSHLDPHWHLKNDVGFDSLDLAELTARIDAEFGIDIFEKGIVRTVGEVLSKLNIEA